MSDMATETHRTPQESAEYLARSLEENTVALNRVRNRNRWLAACIIVLALTLGLVVKFNYDGNVSRCESGNELRVDIDLKWEAITDVLRASDPEPTAEAEEFYALLSEDLEKRDCSDINWLGQ